MPSAAHLLSSEARSAQAARHLQASSSKVGFAVWLVGLSSGRSSSADSTAQDTTNMRRRLLRLFQYERPKTRPLAPLQDIAPG